MTYFLGACEAAVRSKYQGHQKLPSAELVGTVIILHADADDSHSATCSNSFHYRKRIITFPKKYFIHAIPHVLSESVLMSLVVGC